MLTFALQVTDAGGLSSEDTVTVTIAAALLTASFHSVPASHNGVAFTFELRFSEDVRLSYRTLGSGGGALQRDERKRDSSASAQPDERDTQRGVGDYHHAGRDRGHHLRAGWGPALQLGLGDMHGWRQEALEQPVSDRRAIGRPDPVDASRPRVMWRLHGFGALSNPGLQVERAATSSPQARPTRSSSGEP